MKLVGGQNNSYTYQWYKNGSIVSGATSSSYTFTPSAIGTTTLYCEVTNNAGTVTSRTATITANNILDLIPNTTSYPASKWSVSSSSDFTMTIGSSSATFKSASTDGTRSASIAINASEYNKLKLNIKAISSGTGGHSTLPKVNVGLYDSSGSKITGWSATVLNGTSASSGDVTYNISSVIGTVYFRVYIEQPASGSTYNTVVEIYKAQFIE